MPTVQEVQSLYDEIDIDIDAEMQMWDFLRLMKVAGTYKGMFRAEVSFTLEDVPTDKLRECLRFFPLADSYISKLSSEELCETVANYLDIKPTTNLREELPESVCNVRQLMEYAKNKAMHERQGAPKMAGDRLIRGVFELGL